MGGRRLGGALVCLLLLATGCSEDADDAVALPTPLAASAICDRLDLGAVSRTLDVEATAAEPEGVACVVTTDRGRVAIAATDPADLGDLDGEDPYSVVETRLAGLTGSYTEVTTIELDDAGARASRVEGSRATAAVVEAGGHLFGLTAPRSLASSDRVEDLARLLASTYA